jgi:hypothetical protein
MDRRGIDRKYRPDRRVDRWLFDAPYGMWTLADGREVLFNRFYAPIAERLHPGAPAVEADPYSWVHWQRQEHYFHDGSFRSSEREATMLKLNAVLKAWGLPRLKKPPR